jgi:hypothetical protein
MPKRTSRDDVDRLGSWYTAPKAKKVTPADKVTAIMAPRSGVTGSEARDKVMAETLRGAPKLGNRKFKGGRAYRPKMQGAGVEPLGKCVRLMRKLPQESKVDNAKGHGVVYPIPDIKLDPELAKTIAMTQKGSPLDPENQMALSNLKEHQYNLIKNYKRKLPGLNLRRKITKGGKTFISFKNILVTPEAAP